MPINSVCEKCNKHEVVKKLRYNGHVLKLCLKCVSALEKKKKNEQAYKLRKKKRERITEKKLDSVFSKLVRNIYPAYCHSSKVPITVETSQCAHLISRNYRCVRWDLRNCYPTTPAENMYNQLHVIQLAKRLKEYYDLDVEEFERTVKQSTCKLTDDQRKEMYDIFYLGLTKAIELKDNPEALKELRTEIINLTKLV